MRVEQSMALCYQGLLYPFLQKNQGGDVVAVMRVEKNRDYTTMSNYHLRDPALSLKAVGLLSKILSLPEEWDYTVAGLAFICKEGRDAVRSALEELEKAGYIRRRQTHAKDGSFSSMEYIVYEQPVGKESPPLSDFPSTGLALTENPTELNKDILSKDLNNPPIVPQGDKSTAKRSRGTDWEPERFEAFWKFYPSRQGRKSGKEAARRAWNKLKPDADTIAAMGKALAWQKRSEDWLRENGRYVPMASTWLNGKRWKDERVTTNGAPPGRPKRREDMPL